MRTPKYFAFLKAIQALNNSGYSNIKALPLDASSLNSNAWLTGFLDSDA